jgi:transcriptional regulator with GAF, ATPase, and Fis domain
VNDERRNKRLRLLIKRLNNERKKQAKQIDILCNDFISAQKDFIKKLSVIAFAADFYEGISGLTDLNELLNASANLIRDQIPDVNVDFFLLQANNPDSRQTSFELHIFESDRPIDLEDKRIENFFTDELVNEIAKSNRICVIDDMLAMGLGAPPLCLEKISAVTAPLATNNCSVGFVLIYRCSQKPISSDELKAIAQISSGLARSIAACRDLINIA